MPNKNNTKNNKDITKKKEPKLKDVIYELKRIDELSEKIVAKRKRPLLLMYYSEDRCGSISDIDLEYLEEILKGVGKIKDLDVIMHTMGGSVSASYFLARIIRSRCYNMNFIVPAHAYSGGTMISLSANKIIMSVTSKLSPIDIQFGKKPLINFDEYLSFINDTTDSFKLKDEKNKTEIIARMLVELSKRFNPLDIGEIFRLRLLHEMYAKNLLLDYMLRNDAYKEANATEIVKNLTSGSPSHEFDIDRNLAQKFGLIIERMEPQLHKLSEELIEICRQAERKGVVCPLTPNDIRMPYLKFFTMR